MNPIALAPAGRLAAPKWINVEVRGWWPDVMNDSVSTPLIWLAIRLEWLIQVDSSRLRAILSMQMVRAQI